MRDDTHRHQYRQLVHGFRVRDHPLYATWKNMRQRCYNVNNPEYVNYGARGIFVCERWFRFANFATDMGLKPSPELKMERINNDEGYSVSNCEWANQSVQSYNRRVQKNNTLGVVGISPVGKRFRVWISLGKRGSSKYLSGTFATTQDAFVARASAIKRYLSGDNISDLFIKKPPHNSTTGVTGVTCYRDGVRYQAVTRDGGRPKYLGLYESINVAKEAILKWEDEKK